MKCIRLYLFSILASIFLGLLSSCKDDALELSAPRIEGGNEFVCSSRCKSYTLSVKAPGDWEIVSEAGWVYIPVAEREGNGDGTVVAYVEENPDTRERSGALMVRSKADPSLYNRIGFRQLGTGSIGDNGLLTDDLSENYAVGWGYDVFGEYASLNSVRGQVINYPKLRDLELQYDENFASDQPQYSIEYSKILANSVEEYANTVSRNEKTKLNLLVYKKEVNRRFTTEIFKRTDCSMATQSILNIVAQRHLSEGALQALIASGKSCDLLTDAFKKDLETLKRQPGTMNSFLEKYGTHVVTTAYLGGRLDYSLSIKKTKTTRIETCVTSTYKKVFGKSSTLTKEEREVLEEIQTDYDCTCQVKGGKATELQKEIDEKISKKEVINNALFARWEADFNDAAYLLKNNLATLIETNVIPLYDLIEDPVLKKAVADAIVREASSEENSYFTENDYVCSVPLGSFANQPAGSLFVVYDTRASGDRSSKVPVAEVCLEYIPSIRTDKGVLVVYPIQPDGKPDQRRGFFIGDGEGHTPGRVIWNKNQCTYLVDYTFNPKDKVDQVYVYKYDVFGRNESYFPRQKDLVPVLASLDLPDGLTARSYVKIGRNYWAYLSGDYSREEAVRLCPNDGTFAFRCPGAEDIQQLGNFLANDFSPLLDADGRSRLNFPGGKSFWLTETSAGFNCMTLFLSGASDTKSDSGGTHKLLLVRKDNYHY